MSLLLVVLERKGDLQQSMSTAPVGGSSPARNTLHETDMYTARRQSGCLRSCLSMCSCTLVCLLFCMLATSLCIGADLSPGVAHRLQGVQDVEYEPLEDGLVLGVDVLECAQLLHDLGDHLVAEDGVEDAGEHAHDEVDDGLLGKVAAVDDRRRTDCRLLNTRWLAAVS